MGECGMMMGGAGMAWMGLFWLLLIGLIVGGVWLVVRASRGTPTQDEQSALAVLAERFARGEIDRDEFEERRRVLRD